MKIAVGISGGVDSSVAAWLLKKQGYDVFGMFMINWHDVTGVLSGNCESDEDRMFAEMVARKLDIPLIVVDLSAEYKERIVEYMFSEYQKGRTPNPDVLCNREIKWDVFLNKALELGADFVATGHYCQKSEMEVDGQKIFQLLAGEDKNKDQSYFLCQVSQYQLSKAQFPIGHYAKKDVREIAENAGLPTATRKDSQGLCFIGKIDLPTFLQQKLKAQSGFIVEITDSQEKIKFISGIENLNEDQCLWLSDPQKLKPQDGKIVGEHQGSHFYTIGQRKGLGIGGSPLPLYVIGIDTQVNIVYLGMGENHFGLNRQALKINMSEVHWIRCDLALKAGQQAAYKVRIRYRQELQDAILYQFDEYLIIVFKNLQKSIAPGQFAAWYNGEELVGSGVIFQ